MVAIGTDSVTIIGGIVGVSSDGGIGTIGASVGTGEGGDVIGSSGRMGVVTGGASLVIAWGVVVTMTISS